MSKQRGVVVIGAGIAGISAVEGLFLDYDEKRPPFEEVVLLSASRLVKRVCNYKVLGRNLETYDVTEKSIDELDLIVPSNLKFRIILGCAKQINSCDKYVNYIDADQPTQVKKQSYDILCICAGALPRNLAGVSKQYEDVSNRIITLRDLDTVASFRSKLIGCRSLVVVGNGGISLEMISRVSGCRKTWIIRDNSIGSTFFDSGAAKFLLESSKKGNWNSNGGQTRLEYSVSAGNQEVTGPAIGPNWHQNLELRGSSQDDELDIIYNDQVKGIRPTNDSEYPLEVCTLEGKHINCDLVVVAVGVEANKLEFVGLQPSISSNDGGGMIVDHEMRSSVPDIYAAGDVISCENWTSSGNLWFQMRLWTQARQMGFYAGRCIVAHIQHQDPSLYNNFDCFTHCTSFFGFRLVLLGKYNCQYLSEDDIKKSEVLVRVNPGKSYIKLLVTDGKVLGAVLIGESDLEETIENLIHDKTDISDIKDQILNDEIDVEDYFD